ncbi:MAG: hypothetical protein LBM00_10720 [Deltaproteobacteria bacterium]|jgi:hypothetical protein|nr:hypothetical protein [Deltaproteobacteria bacterium]
MPQPVVETLKVIPCLDLELLLVNSEKTSLKGNVVDRLVKKWAAWIPLLYVRRLLPEDQPYLAVWLDAQVEDEVDKSFAASPSEGFLLNSLAQTLCMSAVHDLLPFVAETGCAPLPELTPALAELLEQQGLYRPGPAKPGEKPFLRLSRRYAVVTRYSFGLRCPDCALGEECGSYKDVPEGEEI